MKNSENERARVQGHLDVRGGVFGRRSDADRKVDVGRD